MGRARAGIAAALAASLLCASAAQARFDPAHHWRSATTDNFEVLFPAGLEELAARAAALAEEAHEKLVPRIGWTPRGRTRLILADDSDLPGGWASPWPYNQMFISPTPPRPRPASASTRGTRGCAWSSRTSTSTCCSSTW